MASRTYSYRFAIEGGQASQDQLLQIQAAAQRMYDGITGRAPEAAAALGQVGAATNSLAQKIVTGFKDSGAQAAVEQLAGTISGKLQIAFDGLIASSGPVGSALTN